MDELISELRSGHVMEPPPSEFLATPRETTAGDSLWHSIERSLCGNFQLQRYKAGGVGMLGRGSKSAVMKTGERIAEYRILTASPPYFEASPALAIAARH